MKIPRRKIWHESVGGDRGSIVMESIPLHLWLIDRWLMLADEALHLVDNRLPHDERGWTAVDRLTPGWGNLICASYLYAWGTWYNNHLRQEVYVEVPRDKLSKRTQEWARKLDEELGE